MAARGSQTRGVEARGTWQRCQGAKGPSGQGVGSHARRPGRMRTLRAELAAPWRGARWEVGGSVEAAEKALARTEGEGEGKPGPEIAVGRMSRNGRACMWTG